MEFVSWFVSYSADSVSWNSIACPPVTASLCRLPSTRPTTVLAEPATGCSSKTMALNCKADRSRNTNRIITLFVGLQVAKSLI